MTVVKITDEHNGDVGMNTMEMLEW